MLCVLFSHSRIGFLKNPDAKHTINFKRPNHYSYYWQWTYFVYAVRAFGVMSFEKTACKVSHSINARLYVLTIPKKCNLTLAVSPTCPWHKPSAYLPAILSITSHLRIGRGLLLLAIILPEIWIIVQSRRRDRQKVTHMSPTCNKHRWAQKVNKYFGHMVLWTILWKNKRIQNMWLNPQLCW